MTTSGPEVSVVMSVYNGARYLRESVESILGQEDVDIEFIIVNDGSIDESGDIIAEYAARDDRIRIIKQENAGLTRALIRGCNEARGKYIARQDADDFSMAGRLRSLKQLIESYERIRFVSSWTKWVGPKGEQLCIIERPGDPEEATQQLLHDRMGPPAHGSVMFRKDAYEEVGGYRETFYYGQDSDLWLRLAHLGQIAYAPEVLYGYRQWPGNVSSVQRDLQRRFGELGQQCHASRLKGESEEKFLMMAEALRDHIRSTKEIRSGQRWRTAATYYLIASSLEKSGDRKSSEYFWLAVKSCPLHIRGWIRLAIGAFNMHRW